MAKFLLNKPTETDIFINKKSIQWSVDFTLPLDVRENIASDESRIIDGVFCMDFYSDPHVGDRITHKGHRWEITARTFAITRHLKREAKSIPTLEVVYIGRE